MNWVAKFLDVVTFVVGSIVLAVGAFNFSVVRLNDYNDNSVSVAAGYVYHDNAVTLIAVGVGLIVLGFVLRSWRRGTK